MNLKKKLVLWRWQLIAVKPSQARKMCGKHTLKLWNICILNPQVLKALEIVSIYLTETTLYWIWIQIKINVWIYKILIKIIFCHNCELLAAILGLHGLYDIVSVVDPAMRECLPRMLLTPTGKVQASVQKPHESIWIELDVHKSNPCNGSNYGIEAAAGCYCHVIKYTINCFVSFSRGAPSLPKVHDITVGPQHLLLIANYMKFDETFKPLSHSGIESLALPLQQMSFESTLKLLDLSIVKSQSDNLSSPSSRLMIGQPYKSVPLATSLALQNPTIFIFKWIAPFEIIFMLLIELWSELITFDYENLRNQRKKFAMKICVSLFHSKIVISVRKADWK